MRKLILQMQTSIDGFVGARDPVAWKLWDWGESNMWDDELKRDFNAHFAAIDTILLSRKMAEEGYLGHWSNAAKRFPDDPFYAFAVRVAQMRKIVPTNKLAVSQWDRTTIAPGVFHDVVSSLKAEPGADMGVFGGAGFASALIAAGLVDEFQFYINPSMLGDGVRLMETPAFQKLKLLGAKAYPCGMVVSRYASAGQMSDV